MEPSRYDPASRSRKPGAPGARSTRKPQRVWAIRFRLDRDGRRRDRVLFEFAIDSKLRGCDVLKIGIGGLVAGGRVRSRAIVVQRKSPLDPDVLPVFHPV